MPEPKAGDPKRTASARRVRAPVPIHLRLIVAAVTAGAAVALFLALSDDQPVTVDASSDVPARRPAPVPGPASPAQAGPPTPSGDAGAEVEAEEGEDSDDDDDVAPGSADAGLPSEATAGARPGGAPAPRKRAKRTGAGARDNAGGAASAHARAAMQPERDGGAPPATSETAAHRKPPVGEPVRHASTKAEDDDREQAGDLVLVPRFVPNGGATLEGRVVDAESGRAVSGVMVEARHAGKYMKATTDGTGVFRLAGVLPWTRVVLWIGEKRGPYIAERIDVAIPGEGQKADTGLVRLLPGDEMGPRLEGWVGLFVARRGGRVTVSAVSSWLPADRAGVKVGDVVVAVNGRDVAGFGPRATTYLLRGPPATTVSLVLEDHSGARRRLTLDRVPR